MLNNLPVIYWDACVPLSYINGDAARLPTIEALMQQSGKDCQLITSVFSIAEVAFAKYEQDQMVLDAGIEAKISNLWQVGSPIQLVEFFEVIAVKAQALIRVAVSKGWTLKPGDAIHLATADHLKVSQFHTYDDGLDKYKELTNAHFDICRPVVAQTVMVFPATATEEIK